MTRRLEGLRRGLLACGTLLVLCGCGDRTHEDIRAAPPPDLVTDGAGRDIG